MEISFSHSQTDKCDASLVSRRRLFGRSVFGLFFCQQTFYLGALLFVGRPLKQVAEASQILTMQKTFHLEPPFAGRGNRPCSRACTLASNAYPRGHNETVTA